MTTIRTIARAALAAVCTVTAASAADKPKAVPPTKQLVNRPTNPPATAIVSPRDAASGLPTCKRQHTPIRLAVPNIVGEVKFPAANARDVKAGVQQIKDAAKPAGGGGQASAQKVTDGWGLTKGILNIPAGVGKVLTGKVDAGVDQIKHGTEQIKASTDKDTTNDPSKQPKGESTGK